MGFDGYVRVSRVGGRSGPAYISPSVQREAIEAWAKLNDAEILAWHVDEDQSGGSQQRPKLREAMRRIESGQSEGLVCWRLDRFARNISGAVKDIETIEAAGAQLVCVSDGIDTRGPLGALLRTMLLAFATFERDRMVAGWDIAKTKAIERGAHIGPTPIGYARNPDGTLTPGDHSEDIREAFRRAARGGIHAAWAYLLANVPNRRWTLSTVRRTLGKRVYLGELAYGELVNARAHEPLVTPGVFLAAHSQPGERRKAKASFPLSGVLRCRTCGAPMIGSRAGRQGTRTYRCNASLAYFQGAKCARPANITAHRIEAYVLERVRPLLAGVRAVVPESSNELARAEAALLEADTELHAFAADLTLRRVLGERYHEHLRTRVQALEDARQGYRALEQQTGARQQLILLEDVGIEDLGWVLRSIGRSVLVAPGRADLESRVAIVDNGEVDASLGE